MRCTLRPCVQRNLLRHRRVKLRRLRLIRSLDPSPSASVIYGPPQWARPSYTKGFAGADFSLQPDGTLRCPAGCPLYAQERRPERNGSLRVPYAARIGPCRSCLLREQCQESATTIKARRVSAVYWPTPSHASISNESPPAPREPAPPSFPHPVLWRDWQRRFHRREMVKLDRHQRVEHRLAETVLPDQSPPVRLLSRAERAHWRLSWTQRLACNARPKAALNISIKQIADTRRFRQFSRPPHCLSGARLR